MDKFQAMQAFIRVVESGTFTKAAQTLDLPKTAVSRLIASLEVELGTKLLNRTTRRVSTTADGAAYYERALQLIRPGGLIAIDNVLWDGLPIDPSVTDDDTEAIRAFNAKVYSDARVAISLVPLGDGLTLACKL